jgi:hypothetical protein
MDLGLKCNISKFADDTKIFHEVSSPTKSTLIQHDLSQLLNWSETWQMQFNASKCKVVHFGKNNEKRPYQIGNALLDSCSCEKDLGVAIHDSIKSSSHINEQVKKANQILGLIFRTLEYKTKHNIVPIYCSLVRPHLEYCVQAWAPHLKKDIIQLENVQKRAVNMIVGLRGQTYEDKLRELNLFSLTKRRLRGDLIETFKILKGFDKIDSTKFFTLATSNTRGHSLKLYKKNVNSNIRKFFFTQRVVEVWNRLPQSVVEAVSVNSFKDLLDRHFTAVGIV